MDKPLNLIKLSVGTETVAGLEEWQSLKRRTYADGNPRHVTRMWPKREAEIVGQGSIYWVIKGVVLARQKILRFDEVRGDDGIRRCAIVLDPKLVRTEAVGKRPFQGWRYYTDADAPRDLRQSKGETPDIPPKLIAALAEIGVR